MKVKNNSARAYHVGGVLVPPGATLPVPDSAEKDIDGITDLEIIGGKVIEEDKGMTKAQLQDALAEKDIPFSATANKAELQALLDAA